MTENGSPTEEPKQREFFKSKSKKNAVSRKDDFLIRASPFYAALQRAGCFCR